MALDALHRPGAARRRTWRMGDLWMGAEFRIPLCGAKRVPRSDACHETVARVALWRLRSTAWRSRHGPGLARASAGAARPGTPCARSPGIWSFRIARSYSIPIRMPRPDSTSDSPDALHTIDRREALRRAALMLGGVISAPVIAGVLAGCEGRPGRGGGGGGRRSGALSSEQLELVATIAEHILPETDTPGARAVGVHEFIDAMLAEGY